MKEPVTAVKTIHTRTPIRPYYRPKPCPSNEHGQPNVRCPRVQSRPAKLAPSSVRQAPQTSTPAMANAPLQNTHEVSCRFVLSGTVSHAHARMNSDARIESWCRPHLMLSPSQRSTRPNQQQSQPQPRRGESLRGQGECPSILPQTSGHKHRPCSTQAHGGM